MKHKVFSIFDSKIGSYMPPFCNRSKGEAIRNVMTALQDKKSAIGMYPSDFTLFELGEFDDESGLMIPHSSPNSIGVLVEFLASLDNGITTEQ